VVCLSLEPSIPHTPLFLSLSSFFLCFGRALPTQWLESLAPWFLTDETWPLCPGRGRLFSSSADGGGVSAPKK